jgi:diaminohydroxyphosphoribosylaminopyrimidine deaminase / 5-amino-6-(5-phosphoribosylamino)uracil reductase
LVNLNKKKVAAAGLHETYMKRCLDLARLGLGSTAPNPMVGSVVVHRNKVIGEGYHHEYGGNHAEVNAVQSIKDKNLLKSSILYVNLEPCSHTGKTPPCADMIVRHEIPEVIIGSVDPNPLVAGKGISILEKAGVKVTSGIMPDQCYELNRRFFTYHQQKRPYIILKWAQTRDGFLDVLREKPGITESSWITNEISRVLVHKWRSKEQSILVGTQTALMDNPRLNVREWKGKSPLRIVIDRKLRLPGSLNLFDNSVETLVINEKTDMTEGKTRFVKLGFANNVIPALLNYLYDQGIQSVLVEGGGKMINSFLKENLWDEARVFAGQKQFGTGIPAPVIEKIIPEKYPLREDFLYLYRNTSPEPSLES